MARKTLQVKDLLLLELVIKILLKEAKDQVLLGLWTCREKSLIWERSRI